MKRRPNAIQIEAAILGAFLLLSLAVALAGYLP